MITGLSLPLPQQPPWPAELPQGLWSLLTWSFTNFMNLCIFKLMYRTKKTFLCKIQQAGNNFYNRNTYKGCIQMCVFTYTHTHMTVYVVNWLMNYALCALWNQFPGNKYFVWCVSITSSWITSCPLKVTAILNSWCPMPHRN